MLSLSWKVAEAYHAMTWLPAEISGPASTTPGHQRQPSEHMCMSPQTLLLSAMPMPAGTAEELSLFQRAGDRSLTQQGRLVGAKVWLAWDVHVRAHHVLHRLHQLARDALQLGLREVLGVAAHAALGAAEGHIHHSRLPGVQAGQAAARARRQASIAGALGPDPPTSFTDRCIIADSTFGSLEVQSQGSCFSGVQA